MGCDAVRTFGERGETRVKMRGMREMLKLERRWTFIERATNNVRLRLSFGKKPVLVQREMENFDCWVKDRWVVKLVGNALDFAH
jgi:hypothetical protein